MSFLHATAKYAGWVSLLTSALFTYTPAPDKAQLDPRQLSDHLKRAVIASEDDSFAEHGGVDWDALKGAWKKNEKAQARAAYERYLQNRRASPNNVEDCKRRLAELSAAL